jgi:hypothetical protein
MGAGVNIFRMGDRFWGLTCQRFRKRRRVAALHSCRLASDKSTRPDMCSRTDITCSSQPGLARAFFRSLSRPAGNCSADNCQVKSCRPASCVHQSVRLERESDLWNYSTLLSLGARTMTRRLTIVFSLISSVATAGREMGVVFAVLLLMTPWAEAQGPHHLSLAGKHTAIQETKNKTEVLVFGRPVSRALSGGETHAYEIKLVIGQFVRLVADQRGIDLAAQSPPIGKLCPESTRLPQSPLLSCSAITWTLPGWRLAQTVWCRSPVSHAVCMRRCPAA